MGILNRDSFSTKSGLDLKDCYMTFTPGHAIMPNPITMISDFDSDGSKAYYAKATMYVYASQDAKITGLDPVQISNLRIPVDPSGVFGVLFDSLKKTYTNSVDIMPSDDGLVPASAPPSPDINSESILSDSCETPISNN